MSDKFDILDTAGLLEYLNKFTESVIIPVVRATKSIPLQEIYTSSISFVRNFNELEHRWLPVINFEIEEMRRLFGRIYDFYIFYIIPQEGFHEYIKNPYDYISFYLFKKKEPGIEAFKKDNRMLKGCFAKKLNTKVNSNEFSLLVHTIENYTLINRYTQIFNREE